MDHEISIVFSAIALVVSLLSWNEARRLRKTTEKTLGISTYERSERLPHVEGFDVVEADGQYRAKLIVFNQRETPFLVYCVKCYVYEPKPVNMINLIRKALGRIDLNYTRVWGKWNPKGPFDDVEKHVNQALPYSFVKEQEALLFSLGESANVRRRQYLFEVFTSQGAASWEGVLPAEKSFFSHEHRRWIT